MTHVDAARLTLVLEWNRQPIKLPPDLMAPLEQIGPTPPDLYGNWGDRRVTPCRVITTAGEEVDPAMVCIQLDAPVEHCMHFRLGHEVAGIRSSAIALPRAVRLASSRAEEMKMGFSPSLIEMQDGMRFALNGMTSFMGEPGYDAGDARVAEGNYFKEDPPPRLLHHPEITYFVFDGDPGWDSQ